MRLVQAKAGAIAVRRRSIIVVNFFMLVYGLRFTVYSLQFTVYSLPQNAGKEADVLAAVVGDTVACAVAGEHHVARVHDGGAAVVGDLGLALQDVVNLRILDVRMLLDAASGRQGDDVEHRGALQHLRRREDDVLADTAFNVAAVFHGFNPDVLAVFDHCGDILVIIIL